MEPIRQFEKKLYRAGQPVQASGIYAVHHSSTHREAHEVALLIGSDFPNCGVCGSSVRFELLRSAPYLFEDDDFRPPT